MSTLSEEQRRLSAQQVSLLTAPPPTPKQPPALPSGTVALFADPNWSSRRLDIKTTDYISGKRHRLPSSMEDSATWIAWNLPVGTVMTMLDWPDSTGKAPQDLGRSGWTLDLVGSGTTRATELSTVQLDDGIAAFWWREVDLLQGAIEIFQHPKFAGNFATLFLAEWERDKPHNITDWTLNDRVSSFRWRTLTDRQTATLFADPDGNGTRYDNVKGWGSFKEIPDAADVGVDDTFSSFSWTTVSPRQEFVHPIAIDTSKAAAANPLMGFVSGNNGSGLAQSTVVKIDEAKAQTVTVTTTETNHAGMSVKLSQSFSAGQQGVASATTSLELGFTYDFTVAKTDATTATETLALSLAQTFNEPPKKHFSASLVASMGRVPPTTYTTKAERWYDYPIPGGVQDRAKNGWYKRTEQVTVNLSGTLVTTTKFDVKTGPLTKD